MADGAVVEGEDDEESVYSDAGSEGDEVQEPGASEGAGGVSGREAKAGEAPHAGPSGESRAPVRRVPLTQNQLKLAARLEVVERKVRAAGKSKNEKALSQLRSSTTALLRATGHVQSAKRTVDAAFAELLRLTGPTAASSAPTSPA